MNAKIRSAIDACEKYMVGRDDALALPSEAAEFVHALITARGAVQGLEIGTSFGYSALWTAGVLANNGGRLVTIDMESEKHRVAKGFFEQAGLVDAIECVEGIALDVLKQIDGPFDYVLIDADKENCQAYVEAVVLKLADRAVVLTDNTLTHPEEMKDFLAWLRGRADFVSAHLTVGNGMEMSVYVGNQA